MLHAVIARNPNLPAPLHFMVHAMDSPNWAQVRVAAVVSCCSSLFATGAVRHRGWSALLAFCAIQLSRFARARTPLRFRLTEQVCHSDGDASFQAFGQLASQQSLQPESDDHCATVSCSRMLALVSRRGRFRYNEFVGASVDSEDWHSGYFLHYSLLQQGRAVC